MISRNEYFYLKARLQKKEFAIAEFELKDPLYTQWIDLKNVGHDEYEKRVLVWNTYYKNVRNSPIGLLLKETASLFKIGTGQRLTEETRKRIRECVDKSEEAKNETNRLVAKPPYEDPLYIKYKIQGYLMAVSDAKDIKKTLDDHKDVYDKSGSGTGNLSI